MSEKIKETQKKLKDLGYFASEDLSKLVLLFESSGKRNKNNIPAMLLQGKSGAGKTFLAETFAKMIGAEEKFIQCFPRMGTENFQYDVNIKGVMEQDADNSIKEGILLQAIEQSKTAPVVLVIDELDKARPEVDSFLLDFLENGRLTTGTDTYEKGEFPIYTFITSNDKRQMDEALLNRSRRVEVPRPSKELFLEILGLPEKHHLAYVYDKCPNFSIRQAKQYMEDLEILGAEIDEEALGQYIELDDLNVKTIADMEKAAELQDYNLEIDLPNLERCKMYVDDISDAWLNMVKNSRETDFPLYVDKNERVYTVIENLDQLAEMQKFNEWADYSIDYDAWFECQSPVEEIQNVRWTENKDEYGTRLGIKVIDDQMFEMATNRGSTFVHLCSENNHTLEKFLQQDEIEQNYETDSEYDKEYDDYDREYDD